MACAIGIVPDSNRRGGRGISSSEKLPGMAAFTAFAKSSTWGWSAGHCALPRTIIAILSFKVLLIAHVLVRCQPQIKPGFLRHRQQSAVGEAVPSLRPRLFHRMAGQENARGRAGCRGRKNEHLRLERRGFVQTAGDELQHGINLFAGDVELLHHFLNA